MRSIDIVHLGPQKSGTTWLYECLKEHPQVACADYDSIHYFDMFFHKGREWYMEHFNPTSHDQFLFDTTPSYIRSLRAPERIYEENPRAKLIITLRHPVQRAFSHFWHERKNPRRHYEFTEVFTNYDFFASWVEPGFYADHIERYLKYFDRKQLLCQRFEMLQDDPQGFLHQLLEFMGVDAEFTPSWIHTKVNEAKVIRTPTGVLRVKASRALARPLGKDFLNTSVARTMTRSREYDRGLEADLYNRLLEICVPEIERTEQLLGINLADWKEFH